VEPALPWSVRLDRCLGELVRADALDTGQASQIHRLTTLAAPSTTRTAVCHTDFCADNIIITDVGEICVVDNEGLSLDSPEFDLARTWYRWPMTTQQQRAYAEGYSDRDAAARFAAHFVHWALLALLDSAAYRTRARQASARVPLDRLADLLRTEGRDETFPRLLSRGSH
jgi:thiamine kinase-like enzyme